MSRLTLPELNALSEISWHSDEAGGITRTLSDFHHWTGGIEYTIRWDFDALPDDDEYNHQMQHVRIFRGRDLDNGWYLYQLESAHGKRKTDSQLDPAVIDRIRQEPDAFAQGAPTRRFAVSFYRGEI